MARTDFEPLTWEEAEQNRRECLTGQFAHIPGEDSPVSAAMLHSVRRQAVNPIETPAPSLNESASERCDRLRSELKRGREYLDHAKKDLAESRALLEGWPAYERICGKNPLEHLTRSVMVNERIAHYLTGWLERRETELNSLARNQGAPAALPPSRGTRPRRASVPRKDFLHRSPKSRLAA